jgi:hypothetical protein
LGATRKPKFTSCFSSIIRHASAEGYYITPSIWPAFIYIRIAILKNASNDPFVVQRRKVWMGRELLWRGGHGCTPVDLYIVALARGYEQHPVEWCNSGAAAPAAAGLKA